MHLARGNLLVAGCRRLESTRQPRKTKKTMKRTRHTVRAQRTEPEAPQGKTQPAAREHVGSDEAYETYFLEQGEPQRRLAADPGHRDSLEDVNKWEARPRRRACPERAAVVPRGGGTHLNGTEAVVGESDSRRRQERSAQETSKM